MRRTLLAVLGFSVTVFLLVGLKSGPVAQVLGWSAESGLGPDDAPVGDPGVGLPPLGEPNNPGSAGPTGTPQTTPSPGATPAGPSGQPTTSPRPGKSTTTTTTSNPPPPPSVTVTGAAFAVRTAQTPTTKSSSCRDCEDYTIAVTITVSGGRITGTSVTYNPRPGGESGSLASRANSKLSQSILSAQTWNLGRVSGATYCGNAWELSVRDAMNKAGLPV
ncbi:MAG TPA: hypothetical protein VH561_12675 [Micromonosporaceae bacterium]